MLADSEDSSDDNCLVEVSPIIAEVVHFQRRSVVYLQNAI
jgi:hypothetical protein